MPQLKVTFRPLVMEAWLNPTPARQRRSVNSFSAPWPDTIELLTREIALLGAHSFVIEAAFEEKHIRNDGFPRANAPTPRFPGVRVAFDSRHGPLIYRTDTCAFWQHNARSIALGLGALRAVNRYGIVSSSEQYVGFKALPAGSSVDMTPEQARNLIYFEAGSEPSGSLFTAWKVARRRLHPDNQDRPTDWRGRWDQLMQAGKVLDLK